MMESVNLLIIGAGPAGMSAAIQARALGLTVMVVDDQPAPGGQIWRGVETRAAGTLGALLGEQYSEGLPLAQSFRACGADYRPGTQVWQIEPGWQVFMSCAQRALQVNADTVLLATGAQERPAPFPGWTLPGVLPVGAAQILLKNAREIPTRPVWIAGSGPLVLLYLVQLLRAGGSIAGWLDTTPDLGWRRALPYVVRARSAWREIAKGLKWERQARRAGFPIIRGVTSLQGVGTEKLEAFEYQTAKGSNGRVKAELLLIHEGVVPSIHITQAMSCEHVWDNMQSCLMPLLDEWGGTTVPGLLVAGDGAGIGGASAACTRGTIAAIGAARVAGKLASDDADRLATPLRNKLSRELALRPLLDAVYLPRAEIFAPADETVVCRCEELTAGDIRAAAKLGRPDPNQIKSLTRVGMGPCQGRQCAYTVGHILAASSGNSVEEIGFHRIRPPLKQLTLGELASLEDGGRPL